MPRTILSLSLKESRSFWRAALVLAGLLAALLVVSGPAKAGADPAELKQLVDSYAANRGFNGVVLVAQHGRILYRGAHGLANREWQVPNVGEGVFRIGSLTKPITAILVMQLVEENKLRLEGTLGEYLPALYANTPAASVTVTQLLNHTSGVADLPRSYEEGFTPVFTDTYKKADPGHEECSCQSVGSSVLSSNAAQLSRRASPVSLAPRWPGSWGFATLY